jgi:hypothetical protein
VAEKDPVDKALRLLVYAPLGLAAYLRDSAPTLMTVLVTRGKQEADGARRVVEARLGMRTPQPPPVQPIAQRVADGLARLATQAGTVVVGVARPVVDAATNAATNATPTSGPAGGAPAPGAPASSGSSGSPGPANGSTPSGGHDAGGPDAAGPVAGAAPSGPGTGADLPIADYDGLSATQIIERLDGLSRGALERIRLYELAHRTRRTILATIDQLTG